MSKICKACGMENRDEAGFCGSCGVPLPQKKKKEKARDRAAAEATRRFWVNTLIVLAGIILLASFGIGLLNKQKQAKVAAQYTSKYMNEDLKVFSGIKPGMFSLEKLYWGMRSGQIRLVYPDVKASDDPDFTSSLFVGQAGLQDFIPHANFMSLGMNNDALYAVKFEFSGTKDYQRQQVKVPDIDAKMYGRFMGLYRTFSKLFGRPSYEKNEVKDIPLSKKLKVVKSGSLPKGGPSNIYVYWLLGKTKAELVLFGGNNKLHLTVRFLYVPVWDRVGK